MTPPTPADEAERVASVEALGLLDTPAEDRFDRLTRLALRVFSVPVALVTLLDQKRQFFKSAQGVSAHETPREVAFCAYAIAAPGARAGVVPESATPLVVPDSLEDARFRDNPLVLGEPKIRFYAGHPLRARNGQPVGTFCIIDSKPRGMTPGELEALADLAALAEAEIQRSVTTLEATRLTAALMRERSHACLDQLTHSWNREAIMALLAREIDTLRHGKQLSVAVIDIDRFKLINATWGRPVGDDVFKGISDRIRQAIRPGDAVGRLGDDELIVVLSDCDAIDGLAIAERIRDRVANQAFDSHSRPIAVTLSVGVATFTRGMGIDDLIAAADEALYAAKGAGRNTIRAA